MRPRRALATEGITKAKMFRRPSPAEMQRLWAELKSKDLNGIITKNPANKNLVPNNQDLIRGNFLTIYQQRGKSAVSASNIEVYVQFICEYVNKIHYRNSAGQIPVCTVKKWSFFSKFYTSYYAYNEEKA